MTTAMTTTFPMPVMPQQACVSTVKFETTINDVNGFCITGPGFDLQAITSRVRYAEVLHLNKMYCGLSLRNINGGMEFHSPDMKARSITIGRPGIIFQPMLAGARSRECILLADIMDLLAFQTLRRMMPGTFPDKIDFIVLNDPRNIASMIVDSDLYEKVWCAFPDTVSGKSLEMTILHRNGKNARSARHLFEGHSSLYDMLTDILESEFRA